MKLLGQGTSSGRSASNQTCHKSLSFCMSSPMLVNCGYTSRMVSSCFTRAQMDSDIQSDSGPILLDSGWTIVPSARNSANASVASSPLRTSICTGQSMQHKNRVSSNQDDNYPNAVAAIVQVLKRRTTRAMPPVRDVPACTAEPPRQACQTQIALGECNRTR